MDHKFSFFLCVWIQTLFSIVHADLSVNCPNITNHPEENPLTLKCNVTCEGGCNVTAYSWKTVGRNKPLNQNLTSSYIENYKEFNYTIQNQSDKQSGTYNFWIQTDKGDDKKNIAVTLERKPDAEERKETNKEGNVSSRVVIAFIVLIIFVVVSILIVAVYKSSVTFKSAVHRWFGCSAQTESLHCEHVVYKEPVGDNCESSSFI